MTGHLFQSRFASVGMHDAHRMHAVRYVNLNPVRARLVTHERLPSDIVFTSWKPLALASFELSVTFGRPYRIVGAL